jgi:hypothetical protein
MSLENPTLDDVWKLFQETDRQIKETDRQMKETDQKLDKLIKDSEISRKEAEMSRKEAEMSRKEAEMSRKEIDKALKELGKQIGGVAEKWGSFTEGLALPSMTKILTQQFGMTHINPSVRVKDKQGNEHEFDVLAYANGDVNTAIIVEVKSHLRDEGIEQILNQLKRFPVLFPELADKKLYGILAAVDANQFLQQQVLKKGLYFAKIHDDQFYLDVPKNFQPVCFNPKAK